MASSREAKSEWWEGKCKCKGVRRRTGSAGTGEQAAAAPQHPSSPQLALLPHSAV